MRKSLAILCAALLSCERNAAPTVPAPRPPVVLQADPPPAPLPVRSSFEGTWVTDQGALIIKNTGRHTPHTELQLFVVMRMSPLSHFG